MKTLRRGDRLEAGIRWRRRMEWTRVMVVRIMARQRGAIQNPVAARGGSLAGGFLFFGIMMLTNVVPSVAGGYASAAGLADNEPGNKLEGGDCDIDHLCRRFRWMWLRAATCHLQRQSWRDT